MRTGWKRRKPPFVAAPLSSLSDSMFNLLSCSQIRGVKCTARYSRLFFCTSWPYCLGFRSIKGGPLTRRLQPHQAGAAYFVAGCRITASTASMPEEGIFASVRGRCMSTLESSGRSLAPTMRWQQPWYEHQQLPGLTALSSYHLHDDLCNVALSQSCR